MRETELYSPLKGYFESRGYSVCGEVNDCDLAAQKDGEIVIVELKTSLTVKLLSQANERQTRAETVYLAVPKPRRKTTRGQKRELCSLLERLGLGLLYVDTITQTVSCAVPARPEHNTRYRSKRKQTALRRELAGRSLDGNQGGITGTRLMTAYREAAVHIAWVLSQRDVLTTRELRALGCSAERTARICRDNYYGWFEKTAKATYCLTERGKNALLDYGELTARFILPEPPNKDKKKRP